MPSYAVQQHDSLATSTVRRKHLNLLLHDYSEDNIRIYGDNMPVHIQGSVAVSPGSLIRPTARSLAARTSKMSEKSLSQEDAANKQLAVQVNNKRTPSGQFFTTVNPTLHDKQLPVGTHDGHSITQRALYTMRGISSDMAQTSHSLHSSGGAMGLISQPSNGPQPRLQGSGSCGSLSGSATASPHGTQQLGASASAPLSMTTSDPSKWMLPWQTGDRKMGRAMARAVGSRRTPIGAFANLDLAKAAK